MLQGHVNDTIVVNQPRLTTDEDFLQSQHEEVQVQMSVLDVPKWDQEQLDENVRVFEHIFKFSEDNEENKQKFKVLVN